MDLLSIASSDDFDQCYHEPHIKSKANLSLEIPVPNVSLPVSIVSGLESAISDAPTLVNEFPCNLKSYLDQLDIWSDLDSDIDYNNQNEKSFWLDSPKKNGPDEIFNNAMDFYNGTKDLKVDLDIAFQLFSLAASKDHSEAQSMCGYMLEHGLGVPIDLNEAILYYQQAVIQGSASAQNHLGFLFRFGKGVEQNEQMAFDYFKLSALKGYAAAQNHLGLCYQNGVGCMSNIALAIRWYKRAAAQDYAPALNNLGVCYEMGLGMCIDEDQAVEHYKLAFELGNYTAAFNLGELYEGKKGNHLDRAMYWYKQAAFYGDVPSLVRLKLM
ncbi:hypothetical protein HDV02_003618 [Globomyces sp. JEL0801]|nr:hypothetical protein HDV02_003618 [Globomyces sp. JEL0801]